MIYKPDGTPYKLKGNLQQYDPDGSKHDLFDRYDEESIKIGGTPIEYYEVIIQEQTVDPLYLEDRGKLFSPFPVCLYAYYEPPAQNNFQSLFGIDSIEDEILLELNYKAALREIGRPPKIGSRVYTPHRCENWIIIDYKLDGFKLWSAYRLILHCKKFQESLTQSGGNVTGQ